MKEQTWNLEGKQHEIEPPNRGRSTQFSPGNEGMLLILSLLSFALFLNLFVIYVSLTKQFNNILLRNFIFFYPSKFQISDRFQTRVGLRIFIPDVGIFRRYLNVCTKINCLLNDIQYS